MHTELADVIIFGTPVNETIRLDERMSNWQLKDKVIVTDTGSTKNEIMKAAIAVTRSRYYIYWWSSNGRFS